jgi:hypothetical protein
MRKLLVLGVVVSLLSGGCTMPSSEAEETAQHQEAITFPAHTDMRKVILAAHALCEKSGARAVEFTSDHQATVTLTCAELAEIALAMESDDGSARWSPIGALLGFATGMAWLWIGDHTSNHTVENVAKWGGLGTSVLISVVF